MPLDTAERTLLLTPSATLAIDARAKSMRAEGLDVVGFGAGEPDFDTPEHIKAAAMGSLDAGFTKYTPSSGIPELRAAISEKLKAENNLSYEPSQIIVSCGAKHACFNAILATKSSFPPLTGSATPRWSVLPAGNPSWFRPKPKTVTN